MAEAAFVSTNKYKLILALVALLLLLTGMLCWTLKNQQIQRLREARELSKNQIELEAAFKTPPVLKVEGTVNGCLFELVMRGFTNYFLEEKWGAERGQHSLLGGQKPGGYSVIIRTKNFTGEWQNGWRGTGGGGGGGGFDEYRDDFLPGRWLWNQNGFVGARGNYETHSILTQGGYGFHGQLYEEYQNCESENGFLFPRKIIWRSYGWTDAHGEYVLGQEKVFKVKSFQFQDLPSEDWFEAKVKQYFPKSAHFKITNSAPAVGLTSR